MATTGSFNGKLIGVYIDGTLVACATSGTLRVEADEIDATCKDDSSWGVSLSGRRSWGMDVDALIKFDGAEGLEESIDYILNESTVVLKFSTEVTDDTYWTGSAIATSVEANAPNNEVASWSVSFNGKGALTKGTVT
jgi:predicted secreted protein